MGVQEVRQCPVCGDAIGLYESVVVIGADSRRITSLAREPSLRAAGENVIHAACVSDAVLVPCEPRPQPPPAAA